MSKQLNFFEQLVQNVNPDLSFMDLRQDNTREAHNAIQPYLSRLHSIILSALNNLGGEATKDEIAAFTCLKSEQVHKRMSELEKQGKVVPNGKRKGDAGVNITVWKIK